MRTFVCTPKKDGQGQERPRLVDDTSIICDATPAYMVPFTYAGVMVVVVVFGLPATTLHLLWKWRYVPLRISC